MAQVYRVARVRPREGSGEAFGARRNFYPGVLALLVDREGGLREILVRQHTHGNRDDVLSRS